MFTGIIEETGSISAILRNGNAIRLTIHANKILQDINSGDSIAVNGICLTVTGFTASAFTADVMHETISRTSLSHLRQGSMVNLERAMCMNGRFGGHIVTGHIDGTGTIIKIERDASAQWYTIRTTPKIMRYIVEKGSIAMDGISLTVAKTTRDSFSVSVIPHTMKHTALTLKAVHDTVNLENDYIGKYIEKFILAGKENSSNVTKELLANYGYESVFEARS